MLLLGCTHLQGRRYRYGWYDLGSTSFCLEKMADDIDIRLVIGIGAGWVGAVLTLPLFVNVNRIHITGGRS